MEESLFIGWVRKWFKPIAQKIVEKVNGKKTPLTYLFKTMLMKELSLTMKWSSLSSNNVMVSADVVAMDSSLPLKKRDALSKYEGNIPKLGMKLYLNERTLSDIQVLEDTNGVRGMSNESSIIQKLFGDTKKCTFGVYEALEYMFLEALSTGVTSIADEDNPGQAIRIDFGHPDSNKYGVTQLWSDSSATPLDDISNVIQNAKAKGDMIQYIMMDRNSFNAFRNTKQVKEGYAFYMNFVGSNIPTPSLEKVNEFLSAEYGLTIQIVDRSVTFETKSGKRVAKYPWEANKVVFLTELQVGSLTWSRLAEMNNPVSGVQYATVDDYILLSKYRKNDPLREYTSSQALVLPVINNVDSIYIMDITDASLDAQTEGDAVFTYNETDYTKASVLAGIQAAKPTTTLTIDSTDAAMQKVINKLSDEEIALFEAELVESA